MEAEMLMHHSYAAKLKKGNIRTLSAIAAFTKLSERLGQTCMESIIKDCGRISEFPPSNMWEWDEVLWLLCQTPRSILAGAEHTQCTSSHHHGGMWEGKWWSINKQNPKSWVRWIPQPCEYIQSVPHIHGLNLICWIFHAVRFPINSFQLSKSWNWLQSISNYILGRDYRSSTF